MDPVYRVGRDVHVLPSSLPIPGVGTLVVNAYVILGREPVLVDTGLAIDGGRFRARLALDRRPGGHPLDLADP